MEDIKSSRLIKLLCYIAVPILCAIIIINTCSLIYYANYEEDFKGTVNYFQTERFANDYFSTINRAIYNTIQSNKVQLETHEILIEQSTTNKLTDEENNSDSKINYYLNIATYTYHILIIRPDGIAFTNIDKTVDTDTIEELKQYVNNKSYHFIYDGKNLTTDIEKLQYNQIAYNPQFESMQQMGVQVYACVKENLPQMYRYNMIYEIVSRTYLNAPAVITISSLLLLGACIYLLFSIGHKKGQEGIYTDGLEKIPLEIVTLISGTLLILEAYFISVFFSFAYSINTSYVINMGIALGIFVAILMYFTIVITGITVIRRLKAHIFLRSTLCYQMFKWITNTTNNLTGELFKNFTTTVKFAIAFIGFIALSLILMLLARDNIIFLLILLVFLYYVYKKLLTYANSVSKIQDKIERMYQGHVEEPLDETEFKGEFRNVAKQLNDIAGGLSNAIEEATKSERLKTELITNVSHDIKTPLTSIINYVDLMKKEEIDNPKIQEYLEILDNKSQRLKKLTEDLVEASKASSGSIKLTMERLNVIELMKQVRGEFEDRFKQKELEIIEDYSEETVYITADSRYMYRVLENLYINISKYALENSRVYVDVKKDEQKIKIELKNISQDKLNITVEELMQRFVRGDSARTTEGSGLGISIAKSLTELQKGKFDIYLDGDLFKVVLEFTAL